LLLLAWAGVFHRDPGDIGKAAVAVRPPVASAYRLYDRRARLGKVRALALGSVGALALRTFAELVLLARDAGVAAAGLLWAGLQRVTVSEVGADGGAAHADRVRVRRVPRRHVAQADFPLVSLLVAVIGVRWRCRECKQ
jgi:hypothetical protein